MPLLTHPVPPEEVDEAVAGLDADLSFLLDDNNIPTAVQAKLGKTGYRTARLLGRAGETVPELKQMLLQDLTLDPSGGTENRIVTAGLIRTGLG